MGNYTHTDNPGQTSPAPREKHSPLDIASTLLSWVLVPTLVPVYAILLILNLSLISYTTPTAMKVLVTMVIFGINSLAPMIIIYLLKYFGLINDVALNRRSERPIPYAVTLICYLLSAWYLYRHGAPDWVVMFFCGGAAAALVNLVVNFRWKISAHAAAMGGVCYILLRIAHDIPDMKCIVWLSVWLLLSGMLGFARIWLRRHTLPQVLAGYANGFICVWLMTLITY